MKYHWKVTSEESGIKLIEFLKTKLKDKNYSIRSLKRLLDQNACSINKLKERFANTLLGTGDTILFDTDSEDSINGIQKEKYSIQFDRILYEDQDILVYDKPPNIVSDGLSGLEGKMKEYCSSSILVHRLDKETSGVILFAKNKPTFALLCDLFRTHKIKKKYLAVVDGFIEKTKGHIDNYLVPLHKYQGQTIWGENPKEKGDHAKVHAITLWERGEHGTQCTLIYCYPVTGRTHQLRVHLKGMGHPILGDYQYSRHFRCSYQPPRILLHALEICFIHPVTGKELTISSPIPEDFLSACHRLKIS